MQTSDFNLDTPLLRLGEKEHENLTIREAVEGIQIFGGIGSGKTSGSGRTLAHKYLKAGFGGLVLTVKPDEKDTWIEYCTRANRLDDLIVVEPGSGHVFNFLSYEADQAEGGAFTENIVEVLKTVIRAGETKSSGKGDDAFWEAALDLLIFNTVDLCRLAYGTVSLQKIYDIVQSAAKTQGDEDDEEPGPIKKSSEKAGRTAFEKAYDLAHVSAENLSIAWRETLSEEEIKWHMKGGTFDEAMLEAVPQARLLTFVGQFFFDTYQNLASKTRSIVDFSFSSFLYRLLREPVYSLFCKDDSTFTPEDSLNGKIIVLHLPVKKYHKVGRDCQVLFKYIWQRAMERRDVKEYPRPVFLWADEAQHFLHEHDAEFQATARSSRVATVYLTQNIPNYYAAMGGNKPEYRVKSFLGTLATKIFHANADIETNHYASDLIGDVEMEDVSRGVTVSGEMSATKNTSVDFERAVRPEEFISLMTGGPENNFLVTCYIHRQGTPFDSGDNHVLRQFKQASPSTNPLSTQ